MGRQLCSLWFEYDLCLNRKPPSDHKICLMTLIRIRSMSNLKGLSCDSNMIKKPQSGFGSMPIKRVSTAMFSLVRIRPMFEHEAPKWSWLDSDMIISRTKGKARFRYDPSHVGSVHHLIKKTRNILYGKKGQRSCFIALYNMYILKRYLKNW